LAREAPKVEWTFLKVGAPTVVVWRLVVRAYVRSLSTTTRVDGGGGATMGVSGVERGQTGSKKK
jgi:hypothetical protein